MKKLYTLIAFASVALGVNAQTREAEFNVHNSNLRPTISTMHSNGNRASGDTLMYMPLPGTQINATDAATFDIVTEDIDGLTPNSGTNMDFGVYYSVEAGPYGLSCSACSTPHGANFYFPWEDPAVDSAFFWSATSWFNPAGVADNWLMFGPITIPAGGASLVWYDRTSRYRDGYEVLVLDAGSASTPLTFSDFSGPGTTIFTVADDPYPSATYAVDTTWELQNVVIPASFNGSQVVFAYHHNANDQDALRLDEITVVDGTLATGVAENKFTNGVKVSQNMPNPFSSISKINYELEKTSSVTLSVFDVTGKKVAEQVEGSQAAGAHAISFDATDLSAGVYYYSLKVGENKTNAMKMVIVK
jgi:hypothetical protein